MPACLAPDPAPLPPPAPPPPSRAWGQNFLCQPQVAARIAAALGPPAGPVVELGAGTGALTRALMAAGWPVVAVERDRRMAAYLRQRLGEGPRLSVVEADAARLDPMAAVPPAWGGPAGPTPVIGNLPYHLASRILVHLAGLPRPPSRLVVMVQKEVGQRLVAPAGDRRRGLLSVLVQRAFEVAALFDVGPGAFFPRPKITSQVLVMVPHGQPPAGGSAADRARVAAARLLFSARRRTLVRVLADRVPMPRAAAVALCAGAGVDPQLRAEGLDLAALGRLTAGLEASGWGGAVAG